MLTPDQLRAARSLLEWTREDLAEKSGVAAVTIKGFERLGADSKISTVHRLQRALEAAGLVFIDEDASAGPGVRWAKGRGPSNTMPRRKKEGKRR